MTITTRGAAAATSAGADIAHLDPAELDAVVAGLAAHVDVWSATSAAARVALLDQVIADTMKVAPDWHDDSCRAKGLDPKGGDGGEEMFGGIGTFVRMARTLRNSIADIAASGRPEFPGPVRESDDGRLIVQVFPTDIFDKMLFAKTTGEIWIEPGITRAELEAAQAPAYDDPESFKGVSLVLGAGNVASLGPRDVLTKMFVENKVVILKANPVNDYLVPHWNRAMAALIEAGFLAIVEGGAEAGKHLCAHPEIIDIHVTGSDKTHDAIVFGIGEEGAARKTANDPLVTKPVSCELGNVSPVIVVPGEWSAKDLTYQAEHVATMLSNNAGFNCLTPRVIITWAGWPQRSAFLSALAQALREIPARQAYYPGAADRRDAFLKVHPDAMEIGPAIDGALPWTFITDVDPTKTDDICFNVEAFCSLTSETALPAASPAEFVDAAVAFANDVVWGTLSATVLAHPDSLADPDVGPRIEQGLADLRYGGIGLNLWHAMVFALSTTSWGAYPGHHITDIQSGSGVVGNAYMLEGVQKSIVRGPFRASPKPPWFASARNAHATMDRLLDFEAAPKWRKLPRLVLAALRN
ncbi:MAG: aldehyde dehydrogenase family protein [Actinomycetes bacterium]